MQLHKKAGIALKFDYRVHNLLNLLFEVDTDEVF